MNAFTCFGFTFTPWNKNPVSMKVLLRKQDGYNFAEKKMLCHKNFQQVFEA